MKIKFSKSSKEDLYNIQKYICGDNKTSAKEVISYIILRVEMLLENPAIGKPGRVLGTRELVISKCPYIVPYQVRDDVIYILRVLHTSRKW